MIDDSVLDALASELEATAARRQPVDAAALAQKYRVPLEAVENLWRAFGALAKPVEIAETPPDQLDRYRIEGELGRGGMGVVYHAIDLALGRPVAIKRMRADRVTPQRTERFRREIMALGRVRHPNVVMVLASGLDPEGRTFVVMQRVEGQSLNARLRSSGALPPRDAAALVLKLAEALAEVHASGLLHRDLKPSNVLLTEDGEPVVTDFGLVRGLDPEAWSRLTRTGQVLGSPGYWSPEQVMARPVSEATDVYGLGGVLYACLTREPPTAPAPALVEAVAATVSGVIVPPSELCPNLDPELERICMRALATDPNQRTRSAAALAKELRDWLAGRHGRSKRTTLGVAAASLATISLVALLALSRLADTPRATPRASTPPPASTPTVAPPPDHLAQARDKHREHAHQDVLDLVRVVLKDDPRNGEALLLRALANHELGAVAAAISDCTDLIELEPNNADAWALRGTLYGLRRQNDKALSDSSRALELDPKHVGAWLEHAAARAMSGDPKGAIEDYSELITFDPDNVRARLRRGAAHFQLGEWPKAIADCDAAIKVGNHPKAYEIRAQARFNLADWQGAEADASHSLKLHDCMSPRVFRGAARIRQGKLEAGIAELQLVIERCLPGDWRVPQAKAFLKEGLAAQQRAAALDQLAR